MSWLPFEFARPWALLLGAIAIYLTIRLSRNSLSGQSPGRARFSLYLRIFLITILTLSLADMRLALKAKNLTVLFLADISASVPQAGWEQVLEDYTRRSGDLRKGDQVGLIVFGKDAGVERPPSANLGTPESVTDIHSVIDRDGTDIAGALRLADATFEGIAEDGGRRVVVISDGNANRGDELLEARNLALSGAVVDVFPMHYEYRDEVMVDSLLVPPQVHPEEPYSVVAILRSELDTTGKVQLYENDRLVATRDVELTRGKTRVEFPRVQRDKMRYRYEARLVLDEEHDTLAKNNVGHASTMVRGEARVLFIGDGTEHAELLESLTGARIVYEVVAPNMVPLDPGEYFLYDCIILANVSSWDLGVDTQKLLHRVVKNLGIGFIMIGGPESFGAGGYKGTPIEKLLPVEMDVKQREIIPNGALGMILHTCEFANGNMWAKRIAQIAIEALTPEDFVGILVWGNTGKDEWGVPMQQVRDKGAIISRIHQLQPRDMQSFAPGMDMALKGLQQVPATSKHMVIISDGDPMPPTKQTMDGLIQAKISVTTICIAPHSGRATGTMKKIAEDTGGNYYFVDDPRKLPQIFFREALKVRRNLITEETFTPAIQFVSDAIRGIEQDGFPPLHGYVITSPKALAETALVSHHDDPILSQWRYGLAKTAAFTSDATGRWAVDWLGWPGFETFWAQLVRSVAHRGGDDIFRVERTIDGERGRLHLDAIDPDGHFIDNLAVSGRVVDPQFEEEVVTFQQTGPGRYEASFNASRSGSYLLSLEYDDGAGFKGGTQTGLNVSYSPEFRHLDSNDERLAALAAATGGRVLTEADDPFDRTFPVRVSRTPLWEELLWWSLLFFFLDIFLRRVRINLDPARQLLRALARRQEKAPSEAGALKAFIEKRKGRQTTPGRKLTTAAVPKGHTPATGPEPERGEAPKEDVVVEESFTDRLLKAKREARKKQDR